MLALKELKKHLKPGHAYRRADVSLYSKAPDRHLKKLQEEGTLVKVRGGLYFRPKSTVFGKAPPEDHVLVEKFLKDKKFLLTSHNAYNSLGVGTTQLYNEILVYNHKRHGPFTLEGRKFRFHRKPCFPKKLTKEFLLVDLMDSLSSLPEDHFKIRASLEKKCLTLSQEEKKALKKAVENYGGVKAKNFFRKILGEM